MKYKGLLCLQMAILFLFVACRKEESLNEKGNGTIQFDFAHEENSVPIQFDTLLYTNAAGNQYMVSEIQYFISRVILYGSDGSVTEIDSAEESHYVDTDISASFSWSPVDKIPAGDYDSISFVFGFTEADNFSFRFPNPPESNMFWPEALGGGYHYMKLNGKWLDTASVLQGFGMHLGIGKDVSGISAHNSFLVTIVAQTISIEKDATKEIKLVMNIENWFQNPNVYNFNIFGGKIMQNQTAMETLSANGDNVFTIVI